MSEALQFVLTLVLGFAAFVFFVFALACYLDAQMFQRRAQQLENDLKALKEARGPLVDGVTHLALQYCDPSAGNEQAEEMGLPLAATQLPPCFCPAGAMLESVRHKYAMLSVGVKYLATHNCK